MMQSARAPLLAGVLLLGDFRRADASTTDGEHPASDNRAPRVEVFGVPRTHRTMPTEENLRALESDTLMRESFVITFRLLLAKTFKVMSSPQTAENKAWVAKAHEELLASLTFTGPLTKSLLRGEVLKASDDLAIERAQIQERLSAAERVAESGGDKRQGSTDRRQALRESETLLGALRTLRKKGDLVNTLLECISPPSTRAI